MTSHKNDGVKTPAESGRIATSKQPEQPHYKLADLLAQCDCRVEPNDDDNEWLSAPAMGRELL